MAIKTSGSLALSEIAAEFGDTSPFSLSEYYRGGENVPNVTQNNAVPTSGTISIGNFYGAVNQWTTQWNTQWNTSQTTGKSTTTSWNTSVTVTEGEFGPSGDYGWVEPYVCDWRNVQWNGISVGDHPEGVSSWTVGNYTYYRGSTSEPGPPSMNVGCGSVPEPAAFLYSIYRTYVSSRSTSRSTTTSYTTSWSTSRTTSKLTP